LKVVGTKRARLQKKGGVLGKTDLSTQKFGGNGENTRHRTVGPKTRLNAITQKAKVFCPTITKGHKNKKTGFGGVGV